MTSFEKYIKYKNKYVNFKNKLGGAPAEELTSMNAIGNSIGTCWFHVILSLFTFGDKTKDDFDKFITIKQTDSANSTYESLDEKIFSRILHDADISDKLYNFMKNDGIFKYEDSLLENKSSLQGNYIIPVTSLLNSLILRFENRKNSNVLKVDEQCETDINELYNTLFNRRKSTIGGSTDDRFNMSNLLSIIIYNKQTNIIFEMLKLIDQGFINDFKNCNNYGTGLVIEEHIFSIFYRNRMYIYANNNVLQTLVIKVVTKEKLETFNDFEKLLVIINDLNHQHPQYEEYTLHLLNNEIILCINIHNYKIPNYLSGGAWTGSKPEFLVEALQSAEAAELAAKEAKEAKEALDNYNTYCSNINKSNKIVAIELYNFSTL